MMAELRFLPFFACDVVCSTFDREVNGRRCSRHGKGEDRIVGGGGFVTKICLQLE